MMFSWLKLFVATWRDETVYCEAVMGERILVRDPFFITLSTVTLSGGDDDDFMSATVLTLCSCTSGMTLSGRLVL